MLHEDCNNDSGEMRSEDDSAIPRNSKRWPREEALALLNIRSDMDSLFRDSAHKATLWGAVSGKLADLGYNRTPEKCKEKFENLSKYHKRTRNSRCGKSGGKLYRFFEQLEAFENIAGSSPPGVQSPTPLSFRPPEGSFSLLLSVSPKENGALMGNCSSSTASDVVSRRNRKKKKWKAVFAELAGDFLRRQNELEKRFLESLNSQEADMLDQDEHQRMQDMSKLRLEHETLIQERVASVKNDAAFLSCLEKLQNGAASPIWLKGEVHALITIRGDLDPKYQDHGSRRLLWEEMSREMKQMGYNTSAERCKEKWENINEYLKNLKENNAESSYRSKTCSYFSQLGALYCESRKNSPLKNSLMQEEEDDIRIDPDDKA